MMLARVADSLYWIGRYMERAEHVSRLADVMLNAGLDQPESAVEAADIVLTALGDSQGSAGRTTYSAAYSLVLDREDSNSVVTSVARARENARQVRDQITTEMWERLNLLYLRMTGPGAANAFSNNPNGFLHEVIADAHLFKGACDTTMSHGDGWRFLLVGGYIERAQLIARLLEVCFGDGAQGRVSDPSSLMRVLRMACALEPYLREYTAEIEPRLILEFLLFDEDFPRSIRFATARIEQHISQVARHVEHAQQRSGPERVAGRLKARLQFADVDDLEARGASPLLSTVIAESARIHEAIYDTFVAYPLELRLPA